MHTKHDPRSTKGNNLLNFSQESEYLRNMILLNHILAIPL